MYTICYSNSVIWYSRDSPLAWLPESPDITPLDFFLYGYVKVRLMLPRLPEFKIWRHGKKDAITTINRSMLSQTWEEMEFQMDVLHVTGCPHCTSLSVSKTKKLYVCIHQMKSVSCFSWQFIIFCWIVKLVEDFRPTLYKPNPKISIKVYNDFPPSTIAAKLVPAVRDGGTVLKVRNIWGEAMIKRST